MGMAHDMRGNGSQKIVGNTRIVGRDDDKVNIVFPSMVKNFSRCMAFKEHRIDVIGHAACRHDTIDHIPGLLTALGPDIGRNVGIDEARDGFRNIENGDFPAANL